MTVSGLPIKQPVLSFITLPKRCFALCNFGRNVFDQVDLIRERRSVDEGISPKMVR